MVSSYNVSYSYQLGTQHVYEIVSVAATSEALAVQRLTDEVQRRFGHLTALTVAIIPAPLPAEREKELI